MSDEPQPALPWEPDEMVSILEGLASSADRLHVSYSEVAFIARQATQMIKQLTTENWQLKQALGYPVPADKETINNPFKCGVCDALKRYGRKDTFA